MRSGNEWHAREYVIEEMDGPYPRKMCFEVFGADKIAQFNIAAGEAMKVSFDIDCNEYNGRWYNKIRCWKVERIGIQQAVTQAPVQQPQPEPQTQTLPSPDDDLPF